MPTLLVQAVSGSHGALRHSFTSAQVIPSPVKPPLQAQLREPGVFVQVACALQPPLPELHSLTSVQTRPLPP